MLSLCPHGSAMQLQFLVEPLVQPVTQYLSLRAIKQPTHRKPMGPPHLILSLDESKSIETLPPFSQPHIAWFGWLDLIWSFSHGSNGSLGSTKSVLSKLPYMICTESIELDWTHWIDEQGSMQRLRKSVWRSHFCPYMSLRYRYRFQDPGLVTSMTAWHAYNVFTSVWKWSQCTGEHCGMPKCSTPIARGRLPWQTWQAKQVSEHSNYIELVCHAMRCMICMH